MDSFGMVPNLVGISIWHVWTNNVVILVLDGGIVGQIMMAMFIGNLFRSIFQRNKI